MSVMVGFLALNIVLSLENNLLRLVFTGRMETTGYLIASIVVRLIAALVGGFVCAMIAPSKPKLHAGVIAVLLLAFSISAFYRLQGGPFPQWYLVALTVGTPLAVIAGSAWDIQELQRKK